MNDDKGKGKVNGYSLYLSFILLYNIRKKPLEAISNVMKWSEEERIRADDVSRIFPLYSVPSSLYVVSIFFVPFHYIIKYSGPKVFPSAARSKLCSTV